MKDVQEDKALASYPGSWQAAKSLDKRLGRHVWLCVRLIFPSFSSVSSPLLFSSLLSSPLFPGGRSRSRLQQLVDWCGGQLFSGCLIFDECHKAKNFIPGKEKRSTKIALAVTTIQRCVGGGEDVGEEVCCVIHALLPTQDASPGQSGVL